MAVFVGAANHGLASTTTTRSSGTSPNSIGEELIFAVEGKEEDGSNDSSPPLWKSISPATSPKATGSPVHYQTFPMNSRTQAIIRGRRELMEMIRDMPESFYELSLKDIVEQKAAVDQAGKEKVFADRVDDVLKENIGSQSSRKVMRKGGENKAKMMRSGSISNNGGGMLLRTTVLPISLGAKRNRRSFGNGASFKIPPMASSPLTMSGSIDVREKEWWKKCWKMQEGSVSSLFNIKRWSCISSDRESRGRHNSRLLPTCCYFSQ